MKIGIYDSGIGGLSVLHHARKVLPDAEFIYYADEDHVPYGEKSREEIRGFVEETLNFLLDKGVDAVVIACNTATSVAEKSFRDSYPIPIVGMEPAVKKAVHEKHENKRVLVMATPITIYGTKLKNLIDLVDSDHIVDKLPLPGLVRFAERLEFESREVENYLKNELQGLPLEEYGYIVLGCTHFNYFKRQIKAVFPGEITFVDGNEGTIRQLMRLLPEEKEACAQPGVTYYYSGRPVNDYQLGQIDRYLEQLEEMYEIH